MEISNFLLIFNKSVIVVIVLAIDRLLMPLIPCCFYPLMGSSAGSGLCLLNLIFNTTNTDFQKLAISYPLNGAKIAGLPHVFSINEAMLHR